MDYVMIAVDDDGVGIAEHIKERIFEPFFTTKPHGKGTGLGLPVVYGIINSHRGFVDIESELKKGTAVRLFFPTKQYDHEMERMVSYQNNSTSPIGKGETILLIEDEEMLLDLLQTLLEENGYRVLTARDGLEAVEQYRKHIEEIHVVLSDMGLPKLGGWEAFQKMKEINPQVKSILASGYLDPNLRAEMIQAGAAEFVQKPYVPEKILDLIRKVIDGAVL
jgi:CheY-like chemotaxis protein